VTALPDPRLSYSYFIRSVETRVGPQRHRLGLAQSFPWFGTLALRGEEADLEARAQLYRFLSLKNKLVFDVGKTYAELAYLYAAVRSAEETMQLVQPWEEVLQVRFRSGIGTHSDLVRVQVELGQLEDRIVEFQDLIRPTGVAFNTLLNRTASAPITVAKDILIATAFNQEAAAASKLTAETLSLGNPELAMLDALIAARRAGIQLAEKKYYPDFTLGIDYIAADERPGRQANGKDVFMPTLSLNIPLYWEKNRAAVEEAQLRQRSVEERRKDREYMLTADFARAKFDLRDAERKIALFTHTLIPKVEESIEASYTAYESGQAGFLDVLDSERRLLDFELSLSRAQSDRAIATTQLFMLSGGYTDFLFSEESK
jgi:outer membrane protein TolC